MKILLRCCPALGRAARWRRSRYGGARGWAARTDRVAHNDVVDLAAAVLVWAIAVPLAFVSPTGVKLWWAVLIPVK